MNSQINQQQLYPGVYETSLLITILDCLNSSNFQNVGEGGDDDTSGGGR